MVNLDLPIEEVYNKSKSNLYKVYLERIILQSMKEVDFSDFCVKERFDIQE